MKKYSLLIFIIVFIQVNSQVINIPDTAFKNRLLQSSTVNNIASNNILGHIKIDDNNNGEIEETEALRVNQLQIASSNIHNLTGLEKFTNINTLNVADNFISSFNFPQLSQLKELGTFWNYQLTTLNLTYFPLLETLGCFGSQITNLDFSNCPNLWRVDCNENLVTILDFTNNPVMRELGCSNNPNLTTIKIKNNTQNLFGSQATILTNCWTGCPNLSYICADDFEIPALQSFLSNCGITQTITIDSSCPLNTIAFDDSIVKIYPNPVRDIFTLEVNKNDRLSQIELYNVLGQKIPYKITQEDVKFTIDISPLANGTYFLKYFNNGMFETQTVLKK